MSLSVAHVATGTSPTANLLISLLRKGGVHIRRVGALGVGH